MSQSTPDTGTENTEPDRDNPAQGAEVGEVTDEMLPEDVRPSDDNPLAKPLDEDDEEEGGLSLGPDGPQG